MLNSRFGTQIRIASVCGAITLATLACYLDLGGPEPPGPPIPVSSEAANSLEEIWQSTLTDAIDGQVQLLLTEEQLTAYLASRSQVEGDPLLNEAQVYLRKGLIQIFGIAQREPFRANFLVKVQPVLDTEGGLTFEILSADFGPMPIPEALRESMSSLLTQVLTGSLGSLATGIQISSIEIAKGQLTLEGRLR